MGIYRYVVAVALLLASASAAWAGGNLREGRWELTVTNESARSMMDRRGEVSEMCIDRDNPVPDVIRDADCRILDTRVNGGNVTWRALCTNSKGYSMNVQGLAHYTGISMSGEATVVTTDPAVETGSMRLRVEGRFLEPCGR